MEEVFSPPLILTLRGISLADFKPVEDSFEETLLEAANIAAQPVSETPLCFHSIPPAFVGLDQWPYSTNLRCWNCHFTFDDRPKFVPTTLSLLEAEGREPPRIHASVLGNFCTFNCAARYINVHFPNRDVRQRLLRHLLIMYYVFTGTHAVHVRPARPVTDLVSYGGALSEDEYWSELRTLDTQNGLRDHTPGSVISERARAGALAAGAEKEQAGVSMWSVCRVAGPGPRGGLAAAGDVVPVSVDGEAAGVFDDEADSIDDIIAGLGEAAP